MEREGTLIDLLLDGETDETVLKEALRRREEAKARAVEAISEGRYELLPMDED